MKVLVAIPSYKRPYVIEKTTGFWLKELVDIDWKIFIREEEHMYYAQIFDNKHLEVIDVNSYRETINAIGEYAVKNGYDLVHRIDDDMSFKKLGMSKKANCAKVYTDLHNEIKEQFILDENLYGVSIGKAIFHIMNKDKKWARENKSLYGNQWLRSGIMNLPKGIELFDDVFMTLEILKMNKKTLTYCGAYEDAMVLKNAGGLQTINRNKLSRETIIEMQKIHPQVIEGNYKGNEDIVDIDLKALKIK